ncbi:M23 family metallopeptidase [Streptomyces scopuliridis]|uniref:M23 family metallopeptidase n=1 Tax=Streptomyces scopuliridis TaxID=452529 RepID=UPI002DDACFDD|nr:M23 family metallopeptidase [Streptomyces scopuliridis]WSB35175.1 M23 family metallopeptidase [Streptomyces scopuliridis]
MGTRWLRPPRSRSRSRRFAVALAAVFTLFTTLAAPGAVAAVSAPTAPTAPTAIAGCVDWPTSKFLQTPLTYKANGGAGYAMQNGSHYGEGYHVNCNTAGNMNQYYALDLGMREGDEVLAPGGPGTVLYAGWAPAGWETCGQYIVVDHGGGYWSVVCHLSRILVSKGQRITDATVIGLVGGTGGFAPHLHFSLMYNAKLTGAGGVYGGQSAQPRHLFHLGCGGGYYEYINKGQQVCY